MEHPAVQILRVEREKRAQELDALLHSVRDLKSAIRSIDEAIQMLSAGSGVPPLAAPNARPAAAAGTLKSIVAEILEERPGLGTTEIKSALADRGRETDVNTVLGTLSRARREGLIHKRGRVWFVGGGESNADVVSSEKTEAPADAEASSNVGSVAERSIAPDSKSGGASGSSQAPVGSNPTTSAPFVQRLLDSTSPLNVTIHPKPPWKR